MPGYSKEIFLSAPEVKFLCTSCHLILKDPVQTYCGHRYCRSCIDDMLSQPGHHVCVECGEDDDDPESLITTSQIFPDKAIQRELRSVTVKCINDGCDWEGHFKDYEDHVQVCDYEVIACIKRGCDQRILRGNLVNHLDTQCAMRVVQCEYCDEDVTWKELKAHHAKCPKFLMTCTFCGKKNIPREKYGDHIDAVKGDCKKKVAPCKYQNVGCKEMVEVEKMSQHLEKTKTQHLDLLHAEISVVNEALEKFKVTPDIPTMARKSAEHENKIEVIEKKVKEMENKLAKLMEEQHGSSGKQMDIKGLHPLIEKQTRNSEELKNKITILETKVTTYEGIVAVLNSQIERDANVVQILERQRRQDRELLESLERKIKAQDRIIALKDVALAEQDLRIQSLEMASYDGVLVWKISNFNQKRQDALSGRTTSIYSPCFYTTRHGYKMCARIYINGDGMGKGNHVSLFFVIMKGPFDALLRWPFRQKVTFMLLDQNNREHVIDAFRPDPTSSSFKRPTNDMNIASGCPLFMPISQLDSSRHAYVKDDAMFLKVIVDTSDLN
ncbi:TNF receptor-associated factor 2-like [Glandiceps talaboti]